MNSTATKLSGEELEKLELTLQNIDDLSTLQAGEQTDLVACALVAVVGREYVTSALIDLARSRLHLPQHRTAGYLSASAQTKRGKHPRYIKQRTGYTLERSLQTELASRLLVKSRVVLAASQARNAVRALEPGPIQDYLMEAVGCFESGYFRAAIVMAWCVAYDVIRSWLFRKHLDALNAVMATWKRPRSVALIQDFEEFNERSVLDLARDVGALTKNEHKIVTAMLDTRNTYAHPTGRSVSQAMAESFIEQVVSESVRKFK